jgi:SPP1 family predicted phage head-tail adaptor
MAKSNPFPSVDPGELRHRVTFQRNIPSRDQFGASNPNWEDFVTVWGRIEPLSGQERFVSQQLYPESNTRITVRGQVGAMLVNAQSPDVTMRAVYRGRNFDLVNFSDVDERRIETSITAIERPSNRNT